MDNLETSSLQKGGNLVADFHRLLCISQNDMTGSRTVPDTDKNFGWLRLQSEP